MDGVKKRFANIWGRLVRWWVVLLENIGIEAVYDIALLVVHKIFDDWRSDSSTQLS